MYHKRKPSVEISEINKLGKELKLYTLVDYIGKGFPTILPRGAKITEIIKDYIEKVQEDMKMKKMICLI